uniref:Switch-associated protein 70 n=1 Tax=Oryzias sinensis TaxID=183150 RepID=A0A8C8DQZ2_9TELE
MMWLREDLLKSIWHAFTALDVDHRGKVSKSQLKVLSYNLCTVMKIPHDPVAFEEHFKDDSKGPLSSDGYMLYLNRFILDKVQEDFDVTEFHRMCWTLCYKKKMRSPHLSISINDAFKVWCIFNFLSEDKYPLVIIIDEIEYFLRKLTEAMGIGLDEEKFAEYKANSKSCLSAWETINLVGMTYFCREVEPQTLSMGINHVFTELIMDVLKQGYMVKKGHKRKNWTERWFVLRPTALSYYESEDVLDLKGEIVLDQSCCVEALNDKDGKKCLFIIKCSDKSFEIRAPDKKKRQEWIQAVHSCIQLRRLGLTSPHREARRRRREVRQRQQAEEEELAERMKELQAANERKQRELEDMRMKMEEAAARAAREELQRKKTELDMQDRYRLDLEREKLVRLQMEEQMAQKSSELEQYLQRVRELEDMYHLLEEALEDERQAKHDEEAMRKLQSRLLQEEAAKRAELEQLHLQQQRELVQTEVEKKELIAEQQAKDRDLQAAEQQLKCLGTEFFEIYEDVKPPFQTISEKSISVFLSSSKRMTNWGPASFTDTELEMRKKFWQQSKAKGAQTQT